MTRRNSRGPARAIALGSLGFAALALALVVGDARSGRLARSPVLRIAFPSAGGVVNNGTLVEARLARGVEAKAKSVTFAYSRDGRRFVPITAPAPDGLGDPSRLWSTGALRGGGYVLRARAVYGAPGRAGLRIATAKIRVRVNEQPYAAAKVQLINPELLLLRFDATSSRDRDGKIVRYTWDFEDGTTASGPTAQHAYKTLGHHTFSITVQDNLGGHYTGDYIVDLERDPNTGDITTTDKIKEKCGCKKMTVKSSDSVEGPTGLKYRELSSGIPNSQGEELGPYNGGETGNQLDKTKAPWNIKCRFEIIAELQAESLPSLCREGQRVQRTTTKGGKVTKKKDKLSSDPRDDTEMKPGAKTADCGYGGADWCDDDYHGGGAADGSGRKGKEPPNTYKRYDGETKIVWLDAPGTLGLEAAQLPYAYEAKFEAIVSGETGTCKCSWSVFIRIDKDGKILDNKVSDESCTP